VELLACPPAAKPRRMMPRAAQHGSAVPAARRGTGDAPAYASTARTSIKRCCSDAAAAVAPRSAPPCRRNTLRCTASCTHRNALRRELHASQPHRRTGAAEANLVATVS
jgi:hypothetical protein